MDDRFKMWLRLGATHGWFSDKVCNDILDGDRDCAIDLFLNFTEFDRSAVYNFVTDCIRELSNEEAKV